MSIVTMKRLSLSAPAETRRLLLKRLASLGWVELEGLPTAQLKALQGVLELSQEEQSCSKIRVELEQACRLVKKHAPPKKTPLFPSQPQLTERPLLDEKALSEAHSHSKKIVALGEEIVKIQAKQAKQPAKVSALLPWRSRDLPLNFSATQYTYFWISTMPAALSLVELVGGLTVETPAAR